MYIIKAGKWTADGKTWMDYEFRGRKLSEAMAGVWDARKNNDCAKYAPLCICDVINTEEAAHYLR